MSFVKDSRFGSWFPIRAAPFIGSPGRFVPLQTMLYGASDAEICFFHKQKFLYESCGNDSDRRLNRNKLIMEIQQIPNADWLDLLFDGRNKEYGAYDLRKNYNSRLTKAITVMGAICLVLAGGYSLAGKLGSHMIKPIVIDAIDPITLVPEKKPEIAPVIPKPVKAAPAVATIRDVTTRIVKEDQVDPKDVPPTNAEVDNIKIGLTTTQGSPGDDIVPTTPGDGGRDILTTPIATNNIGDKEVFWKVEIEPFYPAGPQAWMRFLIKNFHAPGEAGDQAGGTTATVKVQFIVDNEGNVSDVHAISGPEVLRKEAERVIKKSGRWEPAIQNGRKVNSYKCQPITVLTNE